MCKFNTILPYVYYYIKKFSSIYLNCIQKSMGVSTKNFETYTSDFSYHSSHLQRLSKLVFFPKMYTVSSNWFSAIFLKTVHESRRLLCYWKATFVLQKFVHSLKNSVLLCHCYQFFYEKSPAVMPIFGRKPSILSKLPYSIG